MERRASGASAETTAESLNAIGYDLLIHAFSRPMDPFLWFVYSRSPRAHGATNCRPKVVVPPSMHATCKANEEETRRR